MSTNLYTDSGNNLNTQSMLDTRKLLTGKDGQLFAYTSDNKQIFLGEVDTFSAKLNVTNTEVQPVGSAQKFAVSTGFKITLSFTEMVVRDDALMKPLLDDLAQGLFPRFDFQGKLRRRGEIEQRQNFRDCVPDGDIDLMNLQPGEIVKRNWSFVVNGAPDLQNYFIGE